MDATDPRPISDETLLERARAGDRTAFAELVRRHQRAALRVAAAVSGSTGDAADIVQDAFVNVHRSLGAHRGDGSVRSWMLRVVANHAKNHVRARTRRLAREDRHARLDVRTLGDETSAVAEARLDQEALVGALARLSGDDRAVLGCRFLADLSEAETALVLDIAAGTVKSRTSRALGRLRDQLDVHQPKAVNR